MRPPIVVAPRYGSFRLAPLCLSCLLGISLLTVAGPAEAVVSYLDNGIIRIGVDLNMGGAISYLSNTRARRPARPNVVNTYDLGREIQQSYYSVPLQFNPKGNQNKAWSPWPWNATQSGDSFGNRSRMLNFSNDGKQIYVMSQPMQWSLNKVPAQATVEQWITLDGAGAHVRARLTCLRTDDPGPLKAIFQELPAAYGNSTLNRLYTYNGLRPYTNDAVTQLPVVGPPWQIWRATENWAAMVDATGWGLGVRHADAVKFMGGFMGTPNSGGGKANATAYIAPIHHELLDQRITYEYNYDLVLGSLTDIRSYFYQRPNDPRPNYHFLKDREHWVPTAGDSGPPANGYLQLNLNSPDPQVAGPWTAFRAETVPKLYITAALTMANTPAAIGQLFWAVDNTSTFNEAQSLMFNLIPDGEYHTYELDLSASASYQGLISQLRFDPVLVGGTGDFMNLNAISYQPPAGATLVPATLWQNQVVQTTATPEPGTLTLVALAAAGLVAFAWRRKVYSSRSA